MGVTMSRQVLDALPCRTSDRTSNDPAEKLCAIYWDFTSHLLGGRHHANLEIVAIAVAHLLVELEGLAFAHRDTRVEVLGPDLRETLWSIQMDAKMSISEARSIDGALTEAVRSCERPLVEFITDGTAEAFLKMLPTWEGSPQELAEVVEAMFPSPARTESRPVRSSAASRGHSQAHGGPIGGRGSRPRGRKRRARGSPR